MAVWSKVLPLTASCLSLLIEFEYHSGYVRKLPVTCGGAVVFSEYSSFFHQLQLASHDLATMWQKKSDEKRNSKL